MKKIITVLLSAVIILSCGNKNDKTVSDAKNLQKEITSMQPGGIPTTEGGWTMKAKIDGKEWVASSIISPEAAGRIAGEGNDKSISLPYNRRSMVVGNKTEFSHDNAVDLFTNDDVGLWGGYSGEMEITKVDDKWAEGKFFLTGSSDSKTIEVTDGFFRISILKNK